MFSSFITWTLKPIPTIKFFSSISLPKIKKEKYSNIYENFLLIVSLSDKYTEAYKFLSDIKQINIWRNSTETDIFGNYNDYKKSYIETSENGNEVLTVFNGFQEGIYKLIFVGYSFELNNDLLIRKSYVYQHLYPVSNTGMCSCLRTLNKTLGCFYINTYRNFIFIFIEFTYGIINQNNPKFLKSFNIEENYRLNDLNLFYKCFHLKKEIGIFVYFVDYNNLFIQMNELQVKTNNEYEMNTIQKININKYNFNSIYEYCDSIRVNDNRFFFASGTNDNLNIVLLIFDIFNNDQNILMRYYKISLKLYNLRFYTSIRGIIYNNYISLTFSAFNDTVSNLKSSCYLTIFGYIHSNDLIKNNDIFDEKDEYIFDIQNYVSITNNIFGYELANIKISNISQFQNKGLIINNFRIK